MLVARAILCALLVGVSVPALAGQEDFRCPKPGTVIETSVSGRLEFGQSDRMLCSYTSKSGKQFRRFAALVSDEGTIYEQASDKLASLWPLQVGKTVAFSTYKGPKSWTYQYQVKSREKVVVAAGAFDAWVIEMTENNSSGGARTSEAGIYRAKSTYWYAPEVGYPVKYKHDHLEGRPADTKDWEATSVKIP